MTEDRYDLMIEETDDMALELYFDAANHDLHFDATLGDFGGTYPVSMEKAQEIIAFLQRAQAIIRQQEQDDG